MYDFEEQISPDFLLNNLSRFKKDTVENLLKSTTEKAAKDEEERKQRLEKWKESLREKLGQEPTNPQTLDGFKPQQLEEMRMAAERSRGDVENLRATAQKKPKDLLQEYKQMIYDQKKGVHHSINRFLQGFMYGYQGGDSKVAPKMIDWYNKNQELLAQGKTGEDRAINNYEGKLNQSYDLTNKYKVAYDKFNEQRKQFLIKQLAEAEKDPQAAQFAKQELERMKIGDNEIKTGIDEYLKAAALNMKGAQNPLTASQYQSPDMLQKGIDLTGRLAMEKGIPGIIGKMLGEKSQQVVDLGKMISRPDGSVIPVGNPQMKSGPSLGAKMLQGGTSIPSMIDMLRNKAGENRQQFMPGSIPSQPQQPAAPQTLQPQLQGIQPGGQSFLPQAQAAQPMNANPLAYTKPNQGIPEKQAATFENKDLTIPRGPGDKYTIAKFIKPQVRANEKRYGMKAIEGDGTTDDKKLYNANAEFVATASALNNSIADGFNTRSKFPGQTAMDRIFGSPFNQPGIQGAWNKAMNGFSSSAPNREGAWGALKDKILSLKGSDKNYEQTKSIVQSQLDQLVGKFEDDPGTLKVYNDLNMNLSKILSNYTKAVTGSQVNEKELELFAQVVPDLFKTPETATQMLLNFTTRAGLINSLRSAGYKEPVIQELMSNPMVVDEIKNYTRAYADDLVSQIPRNSNRPGVKVKGPVDKSRLNPANILGYLSEKFPDQLKGVVVRPVEKGKMAPSVQIPSATAPQKIDDDAVTRYKKAMGIN